MSDAASEEIASRSRGTPRVANNRLRWVRDYAQSKADGRITLGVARDALAMQGIDTMGLDPQDRKYLETIARVFVGGPVGVEAVAHTMNLAARHADRRGRAVFIAIGIGNPHAAGSQAYPTRLRSSWTGAAGRSKCGTGGGTETFFRVASSSAVNASNLY